MADWDVVKSENAPKPAGEWEVVNQGPPEQEGGLSRFFHSAVNAINPLPAIQEWLDKPGELGKAGDALHVLNGIHQRAAAMPENKGKPANQWKTPPMTPEESALVDRGMNANLGSAEGQHPMLAPATTAAGQAMGGDYAGAAGTLAGGYVAPAAIGAAAEPVARAAGAGFEAVKNEVSKPGTGKIAYGAGKVATGLAAARHEPVLGGGMALHGVKTIAEGIRERRGAPTTSAAIKNVARDNVASTGSGAAPQPVTPEDMRTPQTPDPIDYGPVQPEAPAEQPQTAAQPTAAQFMGPRSPDLNPEDLQPALAPAEPAVLTKMKRAVKAKPAPSEEAPTESPVLAKMKSMTKGGDQPAAAKARPMSNSQRIRDAVNEGVGRTDVIPPEAPKVVDPATVVGGEGPSMEELLQESIRRAKLKAKPAVTPSAPLSFSLANLKSFSDTGRSR